VPEQVKARHNLALPSKQTVRALIRSEISGDFFWIGGFFAVRLRMVLDMGPVALVGSKNAGFFVPYISCRNGTQ
jgi:hypothetical protein